MLLRLRAWRERFSNSLFYLPSLFVVGAVAVWRLMLAWDRSVDGDALPELVRFDGDNASALLGTIAGATITVAALVFSLTAVAVQLASSQFSPRVLRGFLRDRFQQVVMGLVIGTFTYAVVTLSSVDPETPHLTISLALLLAVAAVLAILGSIDHTVRSLRVGEIIHRVADETVHTIRRRCPELGGADPPAHRSWPEDDDVVVVRSLRSGWVQQVNSTAIVEALPPGGAARLDVRVGVFVAAGAPLVTAVRAGLDVERFEHEVVRSFATGTGRTMQEDFDFGFRQLVDVALRALSPAINDPTTAYECVQHLGAALRELLVRDLPADRKAADGDRVLFRPHDLRHADYVARSFEQIRLAARDHPGILVAVLHVLALLVSEVEEVGLPERAEPLRAQAALVVAEAERSVALAADVDRVRAAAAGLSS